MSKHATTPRAWFGGISDEMAYILPMGLFLALIGIGGFFPAFYPHAYTARAIAVAALLILFWKHYTPIRWDYWWLGLIVGVIGIAQWIGMEKLLLMYWPDYPMAPDPADAFNPMTYFASDATRYGFYAVRLIGAVLVVPVMEELFWRDYLWRQLASPNHFKIAAIGEWDPVAFWVIPVIFAAVHAQPFTAVVWAVMIAGLLLYTRSLGACIIAHAVTNLLLGLYVINTGEWVLW